MKRAARAGVRLARQARLTRLTALGEIALGVQYANAADYSSAVLWLWRAYHSARGDRRVVDEVLGDLTQVLLECDHPREARAAALELLRSSPTIRTALSALGIVAMSSAAIGDGQFVDWAAKETSRFGKTRGHAREIAGALHECSLAYAVLGNGVKSGVLQRRAHAIALQHGFHDLAFKSESPPAPRREVSWTPAAVAAANEIAQLGANLTPATLTVSVGSDAF
jgi:hypothetical protein